jgi:hypothetical protein
VNKDRKDYKGIKETKVYKETQAYRELLGTVGLSELLANKVPKETQEPVWF